MRTNGISDTTCVVDTSPSPRCGRATIVEVADALDDKQSSAQSAGAADSRFAARKRDSRNRGRHVSRGSLHAYARSFRAYSKSTVEQRLRRFCNRPDPSVRRRGAARLLTFSGPLGTRYRNATYALTPAGPARRSHSGARTPRVTKATGRVLRRATGEEHNYRTAGCGSRCRRTLCILPRRSSPSSRPIPSRP